MVPKKTSGNLDAEEEQTLAALVARKKESLDGLDVLKVATGGRPAYWLKPPFAAKGGDASNRSQNLRTQLVLDFVDVVAGPSRDGAAQLRSKLFDRIKPKDCHIINVPKLFTWRSNWPWA